MQGLEEESRKLKDQLTGFVETKLAEGHQRRRGEEGGDDQWGTINTVTPKGGLGGGPVK